MKYIIGAICALISTSAIAADYTTGPNYGPIDIIGSDRAWFEFKSEEGDNVITVNDYDELGIDGLKEAHLDGWAGQNVNIYVWGEQCDYHNVHVQAILTIAAPEANVINQFRGCNDEMPYWQTYYETDEKFVDPVGDDKGIISSSIGTPLLDFSYINKFQDSQIGWSEKLIVQAMINKGQNVLDGVSECTDDASANKCDGNVVGYNKDRLQGVGEAVIFVGGFVPQNYLLPEYLHSRPVYGAAQERVLIADMSTLEGINGVSGGHGNSFAAPRVAAAAAIVRSKFTNLNNVELSNVLLDSAIDRGDPGTDPLWGRGELNLSGALSPLGSLK